MGRKEEGRAAGIIEGLKQVSIQAVIPVVLQPAPPVPAPPVVQTVSEVKPQNQPR